MKRRTYQPLELQRLLSGMRPVFPVGRSWRRVEINAEHRRALDHFTGKVRKLGRPVKRFNAEQQQMKFEF